MKIYLVEIKNRNDFSKIMTNIHKVGRFCLSGNYFYLFSNEEVKDIKNILCNVDIAELNDIEGIKNSMIKKWCYDILQEEKISNFEKSEEGQKRIKEMIEYIDYLDKLGRGEIELASEKENDGTPSSNSNNDKNK